MASKNKNKRREDSTMAHYPLVSVIIPVFNSAKYIPQTLESLLYQTMKNFEVVAVDDCSTDNSVEVVESFAEKFGGRLHVIKLKKNTGTPGLPRNVGIQFARGKYICFLDSDDLFTKTALEELSTLAEEYQADVVHVDGIFVLWGGKPKADDDPAMTDMNELLNKSNHTFWRPPTAPILQKPAFDSEELGKRIEKWLKFGYRWGVSSSFCRRDFLASNQINFPEILAAEDMLFNFNGLCYAKKFLCVPNVTYIVRPRAGSISREKQNFNPAKYLHKWTKVLIDGAEEFDKIMAQIDFFSKRPDYRYAVIDFFFKQTQRMIPMLYSKIPAFKLNDIVKKEFHAEDATFAAYLFNTVNVYQLQIMKLRQELNALKNAK